jgi:hypothetical protein
MSTHKPIEVTSHVARDFLQNSAYFNTMPKIIWEYVSNSLDNARDSIPAVVAVEITSNYARIYDNGLGMSRDELGNFFRMHGENLQRKRGQKSRGRFGTGKSAAFGLANLLRIDTTKSGLRNVVELHRHDIALAQNGQPFPVRDICVDEATDQEDGTIVEVREFNIAHMDVDKVISYIERNLSRSHWRAHVTINGHECRFEEPFSIETRERIPPPEVAEHIGAATLAIKVSPVSLDDDTKGIDILSHSIWHGNTLAGIERKDRASYIFGEIDVPILEDKNDEWSIPAFDNTRNNTLNLQNPVVAVLLGWLAEELEQIRLELVERAREKRNSEIAQQLAKEAQKIADVLNEDLAQQELELELTQKVSRRSGGRSINEILDEKGELWPGGGNQPTLWQDTGQPHGSGRRGDVAGPGEVDRTGPTARPGDAPGAKKGVADGQMKRRRGAFAIDYENETSESPRSHYVRESKTIVINLDHPQVASAYEASGRQVDGRQFREICCEVAAVEYAIILQHEKLEKDEQQTASEALLEVRQNINRITSRFVQLLYS